MKATQLNHPMVNVHPIHKEWSSSHLLSFEGAEASITLSPSSKERTRSSCYYNDLSECAPAGVSIVWAMLACLCLSCTISGYVPLDRRIVAKEESYPGYCTVAAQ